ncbi:MAG: hypothetical protein IJO98_00300, partial [Clostridia bacterium]|nr:hypothetical protein [Clostridia bacterium]
GKLSFEKERFPPRPLQRKPIAACACTGLGLILGRWNFCGFPVVGKLQRGGEIEPDGGSISVESWEAFEEGLV